MWGGGGDLGTAGEHFCLDKNATRNMLDTTKTKRLPMDWDECNESGCDVVMQPLVEVYVYSACSDVSYVQPQDCGQPPVTNKYIECCVYHVSFEVSISVNIMCSCIIICLLYGYVCVCVYV